MNRKELYAKIVKLGIAEQIKTKTGKNYTNVSTIVLQKFVADAEAKTKVAKAQPSKKEEKTEEVKKPAAKPVASKTAPKAAPDRLTKLVNLLVDRRILLKSDAAKILG